MSSFRNIFFQLAQFEVEYILVGGMAAVLHGAPVTTLDIDIVHSRTPQNIERLLAFLETVDARYRGQPKGRILKPEEIALRGNGHNNLMTSLGPLDLLCELAPGQGYDELFPDAQVLNDDEFEIRILTLEKLIEIKTETNRAKDQIMIPLLMKLLATKTQ